MKLPFVSRAKYKSALVDSEYWKTRYYNAFQAMKKGVDRNNELCARLDRAGQDRIKQDQRIRKLLAEVRELKKAASKPKPAAKKRTSK
jgi:hypothetical protein